MRDDIDKVVVLNDITCGRFLELDDEQHIFSGFHRFGAGKRRLKILHVQLALVVRHRKFGVENAHFDAIRGTADCPGFW